VVPAREHAVPVDRGGRGGCRPVRGGRPVSRRAGRQ
jgi:hypothetical protein